MTGEETKRLRNKFMEFLRDECWDLDKYKKGKYDSKMFDWIESEIITPYEKQLEQVEREVADACIRVLKDTELDRKVDSPLPLIVKAPLLKQLILQELKSQNTQTK